MKHCTNVLTDRLMPYPRVCAHRGFNTVAPENSMPAFGAAVAMGAEEIEFDLWPSRDRVWVSIHDFRLDRVSDGEGFVWDYTLEELRQFDFGSKFSDKYRGLRILSFEDILKKLSCQVVMNVHVKDKESEGYGELHDDALLMDMIDLIRKYGAEEHVYFMTGNVKLMKKLYKLAPDIRRCMGENRDTKTDIVDRALECHADKVQLFKPYFDASLIAKAKKNGIKCNVFFADEPDEAERYIEMGIDTILTNDYNLVSQAVKRRG